MICLAVSPTIQVSPNTNLLCVSQHPLSACRQTICLLLNDFFLFVNLVLPIWTRDQFMLHRSGNSRREFLLDQAPLWVSSYIPLLYRAQDPFSSCRKSDCSKTSFFNLGQQFGDRLVYASQIKKLSQEEIFGWNQLPCEPGLTSISCTELKIHSVHVDGQIVPNHFICFSWLAMCIVIRSQFMLHRSRNSGRDFVVEPAPL